MDLSRLFQGIGTLADSSPIITVTRIFLIALGVLLFHLGRKKVLEPLIMIPMGFGIIVINCSILYLDSGIMGNIFVNPLASNPEQLMDLLQVNFLQPIYNFTFSNGLIACLIFLGIGVLTDLSYLIAYPFTGMLIAVCAELGTILSFPLAVSMGLKLNEAASVALIGGADGPMVLFSSMILSPRLFVPITIVAYLYLSLTYGGYPFIIRLLVPKKLRSIKPPVDVKLAQVTKEEKIAFAIVACIILCLLFPVAAPLFMSFFLGVVIRESQIEKYIKLLEQGFLYFATFFLGLVLGILCEASTILNPTVLKILVIGIIALTISGIGGILGGYIIYFISKKRFNPVTGIAGVSCVPTTAKVAQMEVSKANRSAVIMPYAIAANISGVITTAILTGIFITLLWGK